MIQIVDALSICHTVANKMVVNISSGKFPQALRAGLNIYKNLQLFCDHSRDTIAMALQNSLTIAKPFRNRTPLISDCKYLGQYGTICQAPEVLVFLHSDLVYHGTFSLHQNPNAPDQEQILRSTDADRRIPSPRLRTCLDGLQRKAPV